MKLALANVYLEANRLQDCFPSDVWTGGIGGIPYWQHVSVHSFRGCLAMGHGGPGGIQGGQSFSSSITCPVEAAGLAASRKGSVGIPDHGAGSVAQ